MRISCAFPPVPGTPDHIVLAEELGYDTATIEKLEADGIIVRSEGKET